MFMRLSLDVHLVAWRDHKTRRPMSGLFQGGQMQVRDLIAELQRFEPTAKVSIQFQREGKDGKSYKILTSMKK
jgi:hypothetical protein